MRKKLRFYKQHSMETCGPACMLMLLDLYGKIEYPTPQQEMKLTTKELEHYMDTPIGKIYIAVDEDEQLCPTLEV